MNKAILLIALLVILTNCQTVTIANTCSCTQMLTVADCGKKSGCTWNTTTKACEVTQTPTTPTETTTFATYCDQFNTAEECPKKDPCAWDGKTCTHFTGCTAFVNDTDEKCQAISNRCITDGVRCVEKAACDTYKTSKSCVLNNLGRFCFWNTTDATNPKCEDADDCPKLPADKLNSDALCRAQLSKCTAKEGGGCIELGAKCEDNLAEISCVRDKQNVACFWSKGKCLDKTCDNASDELKTDEVCKNFIPSCTTKKDGGCVTRTNCGSATNQAACVKNSSGEDCFWNPTTSTCVDKTCANALPSNKTNASCQSYLKECITTGNGCTKNTGCGAATIKEACDKTLSGGLCHWDGTCKTKICENAGSLYVGHEQCSTFLPTCTAKVGAASGCTDRTCANAPKTNVTNDQCEAYLPKGNCITQDGGGCRPNTTCEAINLEIACKNDGNSPKNDCFWDNGKCWTKNCTNAPSSNNTHALCNSFLPKCTVGSGSTCVDKICENVQEEANCTNDFNNKPCIYKGKCYQKQCALAPKDYTTYAQCNTYLPGQCTLDNSGSGCMDLPIKCEAIIKADGCQIKKGGGKCGLLGTSCVDQSCLTAPSADYTTTESCDSYKTGCVVDNDGAGCIDLPSTCSGRKKSDNCEIEQTRSQTPLKCQWDSFTDVSNPVCIDIKCDNAHKVTLRAGVTQVGCWTYYNLKCVIDANFRCIPRPKACAGLVQAACQQTNLIYVSDTQTKNCYWDANSTSCKDISCANITLETYNHVNCNNAISTCTVNAASNKCQDLAACDKYTVSDQCKKDNNGNDCVFTPPSTCRDKSCAEAADSDAYDSDDKCQTFSKKCTLTQKKCALKKATCADYTIQGACEAHTVGVKQQCAWDTVNTLCTNITSLDCTKYTGIGFTAGYCQYLDSTCSVNSAGTACTTATTECVGLAETACVWASTDKYCYWNTSGSPACAKLVPATKCSEIAGTSVLICQQKKSSCTWTSGTKCSANCAAFTGPFNYDTCQAYDKQCTIKRDGQSCVATVSTCATTAVANCTHADNGPCILVSGTCTLASGDALIGTGNCSSITGVGLTPAYCKAVSTGGNTCSVNSELTTCVEAKENCVNYETPSTDCVSSNLQTSCMINSDGTTCVMFTQGTTPCGDLKLFKAAATPITYTNAICNLYGCQAKSDSTGCENIAAPSAPSAPTCASFTGPVTYEACRGFQNTCSVNSNKTACVIAKATCAEYTITTECGYATNEGECIVQGTACVQKNCEGAPASVTDLAGCQAVSTNCGLRSGGCQLRNTCSSYEVQGACIKNATGGECLWNPTAKKCVDKSCNAAEASASFSSHNQCAALGKCTVKATAEKAIGQGCIPYTNCSSYAIEEQCKFNTKGDVCIWNTNTDPASCADKSCATAPNTSYNDHIACYGYLIVPGCTVNVVDVSGTLTLQGCTALKTCNLYSLEGQCKLSSEKDKDGNYIECGWNGTTCANKSCLTAQETVNTHSACNTYLTGCTVNATDNGCIAIPETCEEMTNNQCFDGSVDKSSRKCYWDTAESKCITKKCENSPNYGSDSECNSYLFGCTTDPVKCKTKICEDFPLTTDALCKAQISTCTSNGVNCVRRGSCSQALAEAGCVTDSNNSECQWMTPTGQTAYCTKKNCTTAPTTLTTEAQCQQYYKPPPPPPPLPGQQQQSCTTKKDGGCTLKGACTAANVQAACITDSSGLDCQWDTETSNCRLKECKDFTFTTYAACNKVGCTLGQGGRCTKKTNCQDIKVRAACIEGNDAPCLWIPKYVNEDSLGKCIQYESCKSLKVTIDDSANDKCKWISPNCTTDGDGSCIGITSCADTNIKGGCKTGTDGECIQTVSAKGATDTICKKFTSCSDAYYLDHDACNKANPNCTSDYSTGCIPLAACSTYSQNQCFRNKDGVQKDANGFITSTGVCVPDEITKQCRDQQCSDLTYTTEADCSSKLKTCTSDGVKCLVKGACSTYTQQAACNIAGGTEGACFWVAGEPEGSCRTKICSDIPNGSTTQACQGVANCVSNGTNCIPRANCSTYTSKTSCNSKGSDGICVWTETTTAGATTGKCSLMTSCASSGTDSNACDLAKDRCIIDSKTKTCVDHTCASYAKQENSCKYFFTWDYKKYNVCSTSNGACTATDAATLKEGDCYTLTAYLYSWNPASSKCTQCGTVVVTPNNTNNNTSTGNGTTTTDSGYVLGFTSLVIGLLISS
ncbi:unnamed protein product [Paramecium sonneborni]|uniref:PSI domain-containing protein n=1 Tax=Paramecium sonneborni TaxID=65129 RepID=A0A8S1R8E8_9CILI|nr:unnamed protein product [Paramecium sonneborni]